MEKPKRLFFAVNEGRQASCVNSLQSEQGILRFRGVCGGAVWERDLVAVIDSVSITAIRISERGWYHPDCTLR